MIEWLKKIDQDLFLFLNGIRSPELDQVMLFMSDKYVWIPLYLFLIFRAYFVYGNEVYRVLIVILLVIVCTDQLTSNVMKPFFERLRPCKDPSMIDMTVIVGDCRGVYGFASGHAANSFGVAFSYFLMDKSRFSKWLLLWAAIVSYSRVYLGVHYPGDILTGALLGILITSIWFYLADRSGWWIRAY